MGVGHGPRGGVRARQETGDRADESGFEFAYEKAGRARTKVV